MLEPLEDIFDEEEEEEIYLSYKEVSQPSGVNIYEIGGVKIKFPYLAYKCQEDMMREIIGGVQNREHCLLESPTGTGKTAALLCSLLAWQQQFKPEDEDYGRFPKIYYATRTHTQISQVIKQLKHTEYANVSMTLLASREQSCVNEHARNPEDGKKATADTINKFCLDHRERASKRNKQIEASKSEERYLTSTCSYYETKEQADFSGLLNDRGMAAVDIEDLVKYGKAHHQCPYYGTKMLQEGAQIIFCTYNHILQTAVQRASNIFFDNNIFVFDEAHNIESFCSQQGSSEISLDRVDNVNRSLADAQMDHPCLPKIKEDALRALVVAFTNLSKWLRCQSDPSQNSKFVRQAKKESNGPTRFKMDLNKTSYADFCINDLGQQGQVNQGQSSSKGQNLGPSSSKKPRMEETFPEMMAKIGLGPDDLPGLWRAICKITEKDPTGGHVDLRLKDKADNFIFQFLSALKYLFGGDKTGPGILQFPRLRDYKIFLFKEYDQNSKMSMKLSLICLNPGLVFEKMKAARTVIVTSGTLTPLDSFSTELGFTFTRTLSAAHVLSMDRIFVTALNRQWRDRSSQQLKFTFDALNGPEGPMIRKNLGQVILRICKAVPNGILVFGPSKFVIETLHKKFRDNGLLKMIEAVKPGGVFWETEIEGSNQRMKEVTNQYEEGARDPNKGAVMFAVMRGRVSEGVDFSDELARAVITVGLPLAPLNDDAVIAKKTYNNQRAKSENCLSGDNWYTSSAYRAINQAFGRCIRHSLDWGVICIVESRLVGAESEIKVSKWVREGLGKTNRTFDQPTSLEQVLPNIQTFVHRLNHPAA